MVDYNLKNEQQHFFILGQSLFFLLILTLMNKIKFNKVIKFTEEISTNKKATETEFLEMVSSIEEIDKNMNVYKGILSIFYFHNFNKILYKEYKDIFSESIFNKLLSILEGNKMKPMEVGTLLSDILNGDIDDNKDFLLGCFYGPLWFFMDKDENFDISVEYGVEIAKAAFNMDDFDLDNKLKVQDKNIKVISMAGSGKKDVKLLNISTMASIITASLSKNKGMNVVLSKTVSAATSSVSGSSDVFEVLGVNLSVPVDAMKDIMLKTGLGVFNINNLVPKLNSIYDKKLHNVQVFAGLVGGSAIVNSIDVDLINYGLTRGNPRLSMEILSKLYPQKNIVVLQGENLEKKSIVDQMSVSGNTNVCVKRDGKSKYLTLSPEDFGFNFMSFKYIKSNGSMEENLKSFITFLKGDANKDLEYLVAMEVSLNLFGLGIIDDLKIGATMAIEEIERGGGIALVREIVLLSGGDINKCNVLLES